MGHNAMFQNCNFPYPRNRFSEQVVISSDAYKKCDVIFCFRKYMSMCKRFIFLLDIELATNFAMPNVAKKWMFQFLEYPREVVRHYASTTTIIH